MFLGPNLALSNVCILEKGRRVKNLATKTPYAFLLEDITKNDQLDVSVLLSPKLFFSDFNFKLITNLKPEDGSTSCSN
jgi:hypothetical protein